MKIFMIWDFFTPSPSLCGLDNERTGTGGWQLKSVCSALGSAVFSVLWHNLYFGFSTAPHAEPPKSNKKMLPNQ